MIHLLVVILEFAANVFAQKDPRSFSRRSDIPVLSKHIAECCSYRSTRCFGDAFHVNLPFDVVTCLFQGSFDRIGSREFFLGTRRNNNPIVFGIDHFKIVVCSFTGRFNPLEKPLVLIFAQPFSVHLVQLLVKIGQALFWAFVGGQLSVEIGRAKKAEKGALVRQLGLFVSLRNVSENLLNTSLHFFLRPTCLFQIRPGLQNVFIGFLDSVCSSCRDGGSPHRVRDVWISIHGVAIVKSRNGALVLGFMRSEPCVTRREEDRFVHGNGHIFLGHHLSRSVDDKPV